MKSALKWDVMSTAILYHFSTETTVGTDVKKDASFKNDSVLKSYET